MSVSTVNGDRPIDSGSVFASLPSTTTVTENEFGKQDPLPEDYVEVKHGSRSLAFGIIGICLMPLGIIFSILAIVQARKSKRRGKEQRRLGRIGKILGIVGIVIFPFALISTIFFIYLAILLF